MSSELDADGKGALLNTDTSTTAKDRGAAFRTICRRTKTRQDEDEALWMAGLHYKPDPNHQEGHPE